MIVAERMKQHVQAADTTPLLIFPEGTCVNNEYCVMFKRGAFDLGATVCPVAIKYNKVFVDAFWNSKRQSFTAHLVSICGFKGGKLKRGGRKNLGRVGVYLAGTHGACPGSDTGLDCAGIARLLLDRFWVIAS